MSNGNGVSRARSAMRRSHTATGFVDVRRARRNDSAPARTSVWMIPVARARVRIAQVIFGTLLVLGLATSPVSAASVTATADGGDATCYNLSRGAGYYECNVRDTKADGHSVKLNYATSNSTSQPGSYSSYYHSGGSGTSSQLCGQLDCYTGNLYINFQLCVDKGSLVPDSCSGWKYLRVR